MKTIKDITARVAEIDTELNYVVITNRRRSLLQYEREGLVTRARKNFNTVIKPWRKPAPKPEPEPEPAPPPPPPKWKRDMTSRRETAERRWEKRAAHDAEERATRITRRRKRVLVPRIASPEIATDQRKEEN